MVSEVCQRDIKNVVCYMIELVAEMIMIYKFIIVIRMCF